MERGCYEELINGRVKCRKGIAKDRRTGRDLAGKAQTHKILVVSNDEDPWFF